MTIKTYNLAFVSEGMVSVKVRAGSPEEATRIGRERAHKVFDNCKSPIYFGDIFDYITAIDEEASKS